MHKKNHKRSVAIVTSVNVFALLFLAVSFFSFMGARANTNETEEVVAVAPAKPDPFLSVNIEAKSAYVYDAMTGEVLFSKNGETQLPLASVTKVMTALVASRVPGDTLVSIQSEDLVDGPGGLAEGESWNLKNLLDYTLVISSNSGSSAIAGVAGSILPKTQNATSTDRENFVYQMNQTAKEIGLTQTYYLNPSGLDVNENLSGAYGSAKDMSTLFTYILKNKPTLFTATAYSALPYTSLDGVKHPAKNTNVVARSIPGLVASKTGYTDLANGNLVIAFEAGPMHPVVVAVLGSTQDSRFTDVQKLTDAAILKISQGN